MKKTERWVKQGNLSIYDSFYSDSLWLIDSLPGHFVAFSCFNLLFYSFCFYKPWLNGKLALLGSTWFFGCFLRTKTLYILLVILTVLRVKSIYKTHSVLDMACHLDSFQLCFLSFMGELFFKYQTNSMAEIPNNQKEVVTFISLPFCIGFLVTINLYSISYADTYSYANATTTT